MTTSLLYDVGPQVRAGCTLNEHRFFSPPPQLLSKQQPCSTNSPAFTGKSHICSKTRGERESLVFKSKFNASISIKTMDACCLTELNKSYLYMSNCISLIYSFHSSLKDLFESLFELHSLHNVCNILLPKGRVHVISFCIKYWKPNFFISTDPGSVQKSKVQIKFLTKFLITSVYGPRCAYMCLCKGDRREVKDR